MNKKLITAYFRFLHLFLVVLISFLIALFIYCFSFYIHEGGHIAYGFFDNLISKGIIAKFQITNWVDCPVLPILKIPQQTKIIHGYTSLNFAFGGTILIILVTIFGSYYFYKKLKNKNKKYVFLFPLFFFIHEMIGNFLCGTDNFIVKPYSICEGNLLIDYITQSVPYLLTIPVFILLYPYFKKKIPK